MYRSFPQIWSKKATNYYKLWHQINLTFLFCINKTKFFLSALFNKGMQNLTDIFIFFLEPQSRKYIFFNWWVVSVNLLRTRNNFWKILVCQLALAGCAWKPREAVSEHTWNNTDVYSHLQALPGTFLQVLETKTSFTC